MPASAEAWRKASPDPSESSTKPYLLTALYHFAMPQAVGVSGLPSCVSARCGGTLECLEESLLSPSRCGTSECPAGSPLSPSSMTRCRRWRTSLRRSTTNFLMVLSIRASGGDSRYSGSGGQSRPGPTARHYLRQAARASPLLEPDIRVVADAGGGRIIPVA